MCTGSKLRWESAAGQPMGGGRARLTTKLTNSASKCSPAQNDFGASVSLPSAFDLSPSISGFVNSDDDQEPGEKACDAALMDQKNRDCKRARGHFSPATDRPTRRGNWFNRAMTTKCGGHFTVPSVPPRPDPRAHSRAITSQTHA